MKLRRLRAFTVHFQQSSKTLPKRETSKFSMGLRIYPRSSKLSLYEHLKKTSPDSELAGLLGLEINQKEGS
jgi:hypothetical protein